MVWQEDLFSSINNEADSSDEELQWESEEESDLDEKTQKTPISKTPVKTKPKPKPESASSEQLAVAEQSSAVEEQKTDYREYVDDDFDTSDEEVSIDSGIADWRLSLKG